MVFDQIAEFFSSPSGTLFFKVAGLIALMLVVFATIAEPPPHEDDGHHSGR